MKRLSFLVGLALAACGPAQPGVTLQSLGSATSGELTVELLAEAPLVTGVNHLKYRVTHAQAAVREAHIEQRPLMSMSTTSHSCPQVAPGHDADADGLFDGVVIFNMPSSSSDRWDLSLVVTPHGSVTPATVTFTGLSVKETGAKKMLTAGAMTYLVTMNVPRAQAVVGPNPVTVSIHRPKDAMKMEYVAVTDLVLVMTPEMPSMGHGSSGNVSPTHVADGLYAGTVNFSMAGDWVVHLEVKDPAQSPMSTLDFTYSL